MRRRNFLAAASAGLLAACNRVAETERGQRLLKGAEDWHRTAQRWLNPPSMYPSAPPAWRPGNNVSHWYSRVHSSELLAHSNRTTPAHIIRRCMRSGTYSILLLTNLYLFTQLEHATAALFGAYRD